MFNVKGTNYCLETDSIKRSAEGAVYTVRVLAREDLDRQIVKSNTCTVEIPEFEVTIPPGRGQLTTIEGLIRDIIIDLGADQPLRRVENPAAYEKIEGILSRCRDIVGDDEDEEADENATGEVKAPKRASEMDTPMQPFTIRLNDPAGNSFVEFVGSMADPKWNLRTYHRTRQQNIDLGLVAPDEPAPEAPAEAQEKEGEGEPLLNENEEIFTFPGTCSSCGHPCNTNIKKVNIPYFKVCTGRHDQVEPMLIWICGRTSSSCRPTATSADTATMRSSLVRPSLRKASASPSRWRTAKTLAVIS